MVRRFVYCRGAGSPRFERLLEDDVLGVVGELQAFAGERGIKRVEVSTDDGKSWGDAAVRPPLGKHTWVQWTFPWNPQPGSYTLKVRATDGKGEVQTSREQGTFPDGATGYHTRKVRVTEKSGRSPEAPRGQLRAPTAVNNEITMPAFEKPMYDY